MPDPQTSNIGLYLPTRGSDVGTWDLPENANDSATDNLFANVAVISLTNLNVTLSTPPNSGAAWSGPYQSQSGILKFTGTLTGSVVITIPRPGYFIVDNQCVVGNFRVQLASAAPGKVICAPPGQPCYVYCDGVDVSYVNLGVVGSALDLQGVNAIPAWISGCTRPPYLLKDGSIYNVSDYPALGTLLGAAFGGNGVTTFAVPDERNRMRVPVDTQVAAAYSNRITTAGSGIDGKTMNASGGNELSQMHTHGITDPGHVHQETYNNSGTGAGIQSNSSNNGNFPVNNFTESATTGISLGNYGTGNSQNMVPSIVSFLPLIKT